jgi:hypothetical protein
MTIYEDEAKRALILGFAGIAAGLVFLKHKRSSAKPEKRKNVDTSSPKVQTEPSQIVIIAASHNANVDKMNICRVIQDVQYIQREMISVTEIKCRRPEGQIGQMIFDDLIKEQVRYHYPSRPPMPIIQYLNESHIIIVY